MKKGKLYSETMRELSLLDLDSLKLYAMRWGIEPLDTTLLDQIGEEVYQQIPQATPVRINAITQIMLSLEDSYERREWADRIEGKVTQKTVNVNHDTTNSIDELEKYTVDKLDEIFSGM